MEDWYTEKKFHPVLITDQIKDQQIAATEVYEMIWNNLTR